MAILGALQSAAIRLIGRKPAVFYGATETFEMEIADFANEVAQDIAKYRDWQALVRFAMIVGDGALTEFALPADYDRQTIIADVKGNVGWAWGYRHYTDINAFEMARAAGFNGQPGGWIIYGDILRFAPAPTVTTTFPYITGTLARGAGGAAKAVFDADTDDFLLPDRLLTLGLVWRWRENKKLDATGDQEAFVKALDEYAVKDGGSRVIRKSARHHLPGVGIAWPYALGGGEGNQDAPDFAAQFLAGVNF